jgi:hypothetical protein
MALRWTYRWELHQLLKLCGFAVEAEYSDFAGSAPAYGKELITISQNYCPQPTHRTALRSPASTPPDVHIARHSARKLSLIAAGNGLVPSSERQESLPAVSSS